MTHVTFEELDLLVNMPYEEEKLWHDSFDKATEKGLTEEQAIEYANQKLDAYLATNIYY